MAQGGSGPGARGRGPSDLLAEASLIEAAWDARGGRVEAHERVEFGVVIDGRVVRVAQTGLTGRVINEMRAAAAIVRRNLIGGAPRLATFRWPSC